MVAIYKRSIKDVGRLFIRVEDFLSTLVPFETLFLDVTEQQIS